MFIIKTIAPEEATGKIAEAYGHFPEGMPLPKSLQLLSASEPLLNLQSGAIGWWMEHKTLTPQFLAAIRYMMAHSCDSDSCVTFNGSMLQGAGLTEADLANIVNNPLDAPFEARENALLAFVAAAMNQPEKATTERVAELVGMGWSEQDIFEAAYHAAGMLGPTAVVKAFSK
jgi:alkylhydroperoxidase family enzyme